jgi:hypothetical protein
MPTPEPYSCGDHRRMHTESSCCGANASTPVSGALQCNATFGIHPYFDIIETFYINQTRLAAGHPLFDMNAMDMDDPYAQPPPLLSAPWTNSTGVQLKAYDMQTMAWYMSTNTAAHAWEIKFTKEWSWSYDSAKGTIVKFRRLYAATPDIVTQSIAMQAEMGAAETLENMVGWLSGLIAVIRVDLTVVAPSEAVYQSYKDMYADALGTPYDAYMKCFTAQEVDPAVFAALYPEVRAACNLLKTVLVEPGIIEERYLGNMVLTHLSKAKAVPSGAWN